MPRLAAAAILLTLAGCAGIEPASVAPVPMELTPAWSWHGRISVKAGEQAMSGQLQWQHQAAGDVLMFASPLGQGVARIVRDGSGVVLELPDEPPRQAASVEALTAETLGYALPVAGLTYWVQGSADPARSFEMSHDQRGMPLRISQDGWTIRYLQFFPDGPNRPRRMTLSRDDLEIRLVTDTWLPE